MTAEKFHDALSLLPADLIAETDRKRQAGRKPVPLMRYAAFAASFALVLCSALFCARLFAPKGASEAITEEHAAMQQDKSAEYEIQGGKEEAAPMEPQSAAENAPAEDICELPAAGASSRIDPEEFCIDHVHRPAEPAETERGAWCGLMTATVYLDEEIYSLAASEAVELTDILYHLDYREDQLCSCAPEFTADTEMGTGYEINLSAYFVRFNGAQAGLTEDQAASLQTLLDSLG